MIGVFSVVVVVVVVDCLLRLVIEVELVVVGANDGLKKVTNCGGDVEVALEIRTNEQNDKSSELTLPPPLLKFG